MHAAAVPCRAARQELQRLESSLPYSNLLQNCVPAVLLLLLLLYITSPNPF
jgi:hypothetical protein